MSPRALILRQQAEHDIDEAAAACFQEGGVELELAFIDALEAALAHIGRNAATGSPRYSLELELPGLRAWPLRRFPYLIFYLEHDSHLDVWRVLHARRDIPLWLREDDPGA